MLFKGKITKGIGRHSELFVPGRAIIDFAPPDWPEQLQPGSLNIRVHPDGYPPAFDSLRHKRSVKNLDNGCLPPAFVIPQADLGNNRLNATPEMPQKGAGQLWRALLQTGSYEVRCWVLRRIGSGLSDQLEIVSHEYLRVAYELTDNQNAAITLDRGDA